MLFILAIAAAVPDLAGAVNEEVARQSCRSTDPAEITVCARNRFRNRYQITDPNAPFDVHGNVMSVMGERSRWIEGGEAGPQSCGPVGPGGWTGCLIQQWKRNDLQNPNRK
jgi:hypothetical protein